MLFKSTLGEREERKMKLDVTNNVTLSEALEFDFLKFQLCHKSTNSAEASKTRLLLNNTFYYICKLWVIMKDDDDHESELKIPAGGP